MKQKWLIIIISILIVIFGVGIFVKISGKKREVSLSESCSEEISIKMANVVAEEIQNIITASKTGIYEISDFKFYFDKAGENYTDGTYRISVSADWLLIREPKDNPIIIGMYQALDELSTETEKIEAQNVIDGFLAEMQPEYMQEENVTYEIMVILDNKNSNKYSLYYPMRNSGVETLIPLEDYFIKEDKQNRIELGKNTLLEMMGLVE